MGLRRSCGCAGLTASDSFLFFIFQAWNPGWGGVLPGGVLVDGSPSFEECSNT